jgi:hypothetical protein
MGMAYLLELSFRKLPECTLHKGDLLGLEGFWQAGFFVELDCFGEG